MVRMIQDAVVVLRTDSAEEFQRLYLATWNGKNFSRPRPITPLVPHDVDWMVVAPHRTFVVYGLNVDGATHLYTVDLDTTTNFDGPAHPLPGIPPGVIDGVHFPETGKWPMQFAFTVNTPGNPGEVYTYDLTTKVCTRWTAPSELLVVGSTRPPRLVQFPPLLVFYPPIDPLPKGIAQTLSAWLYKPDSTRFHPPFPLLVMIHGGPEMQARPVFDPFVQTCLSKGLAVLEPNVRGSTGFGKSFQTADDGYQRMASVHDIGAALDWVKTQPDLDVKRMAVSGRSYGGFMALSSLIEYGDRLRAGICAVGISNFPSFLKETSGYRRDLRRVEYGDERIPKMAAFLDSISPFTRREKIRSPLLLIHGKNDPRVPYAQSESLFIALTDTARTKTSHSVSPIVPIVPAVPVAFLAFSGEGHAVRDQEGQLAQYRVMLDFLARHLGF